MYEYTVDINNNNKGKMAKINLKWRNPEDVNEKKHRFKAKNLDYEAEISYTNFNKTKDVATARFRLKLYRKFTRCLVETIFPTGLLVLVCSVSLF